MITPISPNSFIVDTEAERSTGWADGVTVFCKDTNKTYITIGGQFKIVGPQTGSGAAWGDITGTLSAQTDLQGELNGKLTKDGISKISLGTEAPANPNVGDLWIQI